MLPASRDGRKAGLALGLLLLCFLAATGARPFNVPDEGRYAEVAREMLRSGDLLTPRLDGVPFLDKPPLFYWFEVASFAAFGVHVWSARLVTALLGFAGCAMTWAAGARLYGARAGLLAAVVLAASPYYFVASQYVNHDLAVSTWISAALLAFAVASHQHGGARSRTLYAAYAAVGLAILTKGLIGVVLPLGTVGVWILVSRRWREIPRAQLPSGLLLAAAIAVPWHLVANRANPELLHYLYVVQHFQRYAATGFNNAKGPLFYPLVLAAGLLPWTPLLPGALRRAWRGYRADSERNRVDLLFLLWPLVVVLFFSVPVSKIAGYVLPALPPLALLLGRHLDEIITRRERPWPLLAAALALAPFGTALLVAPALPQTRDLPGLQLAAIALAGAGMLALAAAAVSAFRVGRPERAVAALVGFVALLVAVGLPAVPHFTADSTLPLARRLKPLLREGDVVASYQRHYYDLPLYLDRKEPVVVAENWDDPQIPLSDNWQSELWLGRRWEPRSKDWLVFPEELPARCARARCFVIAPRYHVERVRALVPLVPLAEANRNVLLGPAELADGGATAAPAAAAR